MTLKTLLNSKLIYGSVVIQKLLPFDPIYDINGVARKPKDYKYGSKYTIKLWNTTLLTENYLLKHNVPKELLDWKIDLLRNNNNKLEIHIKEW